MLSMGEKIRETRVNMGLTQQQFADRLGLDSTSGYKVVSKWETNVNNPSVESLKKIADVSGKPISYFTGVEEIISDKKSVIDEFLDRLIQQGIIKDINNIEDDVADLILNAVKTDLQLRKLKKKEQ